MDDFEELFETSWNADDSSLYYMIGKSDLEGKIGISPPSFEEIVRRGKKLIDEFDDKIKDIICTKKFVDGITDIEINDRKKLCLSIIEAIAALNGFPFAIFASVIIIRTGYMEYCDLKE